MKWEAAAKLVAGPVGSTWKLTPHRMRATSVYESARGTSKFTSFFPLWTADCGLPVGFIDYALCLRRAVLIEATVIASSSLASAKRLFN
jgi:hypothetical protein